MALLLDVILPALILVQLSSPERLGPLGALGLALSVSLGRIVWTLWKERRVRPTTLLGLASVLMLGLVALLELPAQWIAVKEALIPSLIAIGLLVAHLTGRDLASKLLLATIDEERVREKLDDEVAYRRVVRRSGALVVGSFFVSAIVNFAVAWVVVTGRPGTEEFNQQVATTSVVSAVATFLTAGVMILGAEWVLLRGLKRLTGLPMLELLRQST